MILKFFSVVVKTIPCGKYTTSKKNFKFYHDFTRRIRSGTAENHSENEIFAFFLQIRFIFEKKALYLESAAIFCFYINDFGAPGADSGRKKC